MFWRKGKNLQAGGASAAIHAADSSARGFVEEHRTGRWKLPRMIVFVCGTFQRPVQRFVPATSVPLQRQKTGMLLAGFRFGPFRFCIRLTLHGETDGRSFLPGGVHPGGRCRRIRHLLPPCVPHRHARRAVRGMKRKGRSDARSLPPCRRRETIFRKPGARGSASSPPAPRRPRLAATPCSVSAAGWEDCRHRFGGRGKWACVLSGSEGVR